ncbi:MAG: hypothetical protein VX640_11070 [Pseudomonadota bacterium]|nr:hypothetical protein [Pseudomonadota bacterium]
MRLRMFSVVGEALHFSARRMETIMRVAWLPVVLLLILEMATAFSLLSVVYNRLITFEDAHTWAQAQKAFSNVIQQIIAAIIINGPLAIRWQIYAVLGASLVIQSILVASFMAPLIRLAGLGEAPRPGVVRLPFGPDQVRYIGASLLAILIMALFIFGPMMAAAFYTIKYILQAIAEIRYAQFPNPDSLHTINVISAGDVFFDAAGLRPLSRGLPLLIAAPFAVGFWLLLIAHFHPKNRAAGAGAPNILARALATLAGAAAVGGAFWLGFLVWAGNVDPASNMSHLFAIAALGAMIAYYFNLRLFPYVGVAVCRKSLGPGKTLRVTSGFNIFRLFALLVMIFAVTLGVQILINSIAFPAIGATVNYLFAATDVYTRFVNGGEGSEWVRPLFVSIWNGVKIAYNIFWLFFTYGVSAGLLGRLYRDSERTGEDGDLAPAWLRA